jgi:hypothetical protein
MVSFLFWNINKKPLHSLVTALVKEHQADVVILAECEESPATLLEGLNAREVRYFFAPGLCEALNVFTRFSSDFLVKKFESDRVSIRRLALPARLEVLLVMVHLPSRLYFNEASLAFECTELSRLIRKEEGDVGHARTIVVGDLNLNPFEVGVTGAAGLHAVMSRGVAARGSRTVQGREYPFFYNPMWRLFGDRADGPPGTYYYERAEYVTYFWNIFDQVLIRPELIPTLRADGPRIVTAVGATPLLGPDGRPDRLAASDHLPVLFGLNL